MPTDLLLLCIFVVVAIAAGIVLSIYEFKGKGKKIKITVIYKRKRVYDALNQVTYSNGTSTHYTVDCTYENSSKIHTLGCEYNVYERLKKGKSYDVTVKMGDIIKVHKK